MKTMKIIAIFAVGFLFTSCFNKEKPNYQFMARTDMYEPVGYETYYPAPQVAFKNEMVAQLPAPNSVKRGWLPFEYANTNEDFLRAKTSLENPLKSDEASLKENLQKGAAMYNIYCMICHGSEGNGQGTLVKREKFLGVPNFKDRDITQGSIYHTIYYGKNAMGSYASQLSEKERWQVALYVEELKKKLMN